MHTCDMFPTPGPLTRPARPQTPFIPHDENIYISSLSTFQADARALLTAGARLGIDPEHLRLLTGGLHPLRNISPPPLHVTPCPRRPPLCSGSGSWGRGPQASSRDVQPSCPIHKDATGHSCCCLNNQHKKSKLHPDGEGNTLPTHKRISKIYSNGQKYHQITHCYTPTKQIYFSWE